MSPSKNRLTLAGLPSELVGEIASYLPLADITNLRSTCHTMRGDAEFAYGRSFTTLWVTEDPFDLLSLSLLARQPCVQKNARCLKIRIRGLNESYEYQETQGKKWHDVLLQRLMTTEDSDWADEILSFGRQNQGILAYDRCNPFTLYGLLLGNILRALSKVEEIALIAAVPKETDVVAEFPSVYWRKTLETASDAKLSLRSLSIPGPLTEEGVEIAGLGLSYLDSRQLLFPSLEALEVLDLGALTYNTDFTDDMLQEACNFIKKLTNLHSLCISFDHFGDEGDTTFFHMLATQVHLPRLKKLTLGTMSMLGDDVVTLLKSHARTLEELDMFNCDLDSIESITNMLLTLRNEVRNLRTLMLEDTEVIDIDHDVEYKVTYPSVCKPVIFQKWSYNKMDDEDPKGPEDIVEDDGELQDGGWLTVLTDDYVLEVEKGEDMADVLDNALRTLKMKELDRVAEGPDDEEDAPDDDEDEAMLDSDEVALENYD